MTYVRILIFPYKFQADGIQSILWYGASERWLAEIHCVVFCFNINQRFWCLYLYRHFLPISQAYCDISWQARGSIDSLHCSPVFLLPGPLVRWFPAFQVLTAAPSSAYFTDSLVKGSLTVVKTPCSSSGSAVCTRLIRTDPVAPKLPSRSTCPRLMDLRRTHLEARRQNAVILNVSARSLKKKVVCS